MMVLVYNLADTFFIGQTKDPFMVAAISISTPVFLIFMAVGLLFGIGGTSLISRMLGEGRNEMAKKVSSFCFWTGGVIGVIAMIFIMAFASPISTLVGASGQTIGYSREYLQIVSVGIPFLIISNSFSNIIRSEGRAKTAMSGMIIGNLVNIILDPIMIIGFGWNVAGAAIATVLGNVCSAVFYLCHLLSKKTILSISLKDYRVGGGVAGGVMAIGIPASLNSIMMSVSNIIINNYMADFGDMAVAGLGVAMKVNMIVVMLLIGLGSGIQPLLGYCYGAGNKQRYFAVLKFSMILAFCLSAVMTAICYCEAGPLVKAFLEDPDAFEYGMTFSRIYILSGPVIGILFVLMNAIQSLGAALPSLILSICRQGLVFIPILMIFSKVFNTAKMLAYAQPVTDYVAVATALVIFIVTSKRYFARLENRTDGE